MGTNPLKDDESQPPRRFYAARVADRQCQEMLGMLRAFIADRALNDAEVNAFRRWLANNPAVTLSFPGRFLAARLSAMLADGVIDEEERHELLQMMHDAVGDDEIDGATASTALPLDRPTPAVLFEGATFVFTGLCAYGKRAQCERAVVERGGRCESAVTRRVDYLVIGTLASPAWVQSNFGRKIEAAVRLRDGEGLPVRIVSEQTWLEALENRA